MRLSASKICVDLGGKKILSDVSFDLHDKQVCAILGPNGSGKSTLLRAMLRLEPVTRGSLKLVGMERLPSVAPFWPTVTGVLQGLYLWPHLTVRQNLVLAMSELNLDEVEQSSRIDETMSRFGLAELMNRLPMTLSQGQQQKVAVARAIILQPTFLLLDEVTSALDVEQIEFLRNTIQALRSEGAGIALVTHHLGFARACADSFLFMESGKVIAQGRMSDIDKLAVNTRLEEFLKLA